LKAVEKQGVMEGVEHPKCAYIETPLTSIYMLITKTRTVK
jgi:hypothetical protein